MNQPSEKAMAAAEKIVQRYMDSDTEEYTGWGAFGLEREYDDPVAASADYHAAITKLATAIDDHTAALRAEVEALRGEREKAVELMRSVPAVLGQPRLGYVSSSEKIQEEATAYLRAYELIERALVILDK